MVSACLNQATAVSTRSSNDGVVHFPEESPPSFRNPPVAEVAVSVQPQDWWGVAFLAFLGPIRHDFRKVYRSPSCAIDHGTFWEPAPPPADAVNDTFATDPNAVRCSFLNDADANASRFSVTPCPQGNARAGSPFPRYVEHHARFGQRRCKFSDFTPPTRVLSRIKQIAPSANTKLHSE